MHDIALEGCRATPLAGYLKGLAVLRLVAEQADPAAKGAWKNDVFHVYSKLSEHDLVEFFVERYTPTPIVAPWNGGSGFYEGDPSVGINAIANSTAERFARYREVISEVRQWPEMPQVFETVGDVVGTSERVVQGFAEGKKKSDWSELLDAEAIAREAAGEVLPSQDATAIRMADAEKASAKLTGGQKKLASSWWETVKKLRTACTKLERGDVKKKLLSACRTRLPDDCLSWLDAAYAVRIDGTPSYSPLLGTGGNDAKQDFSNNFMQRLAELLVTGKEERSEVLLQSSLFSGPVSNMTKAKIGFFDPGRAGGYNQGAKVETKDFKINPWDFVLMLEGACMLGGSVCKRSSEDARGYGAIPFTVSSSGVGFASSECSEGGRAESWLPLWINPTGFSEVRHLFGEGRCSVGRRQARSGLDCIRAVGSLGVDRGVDEFVRYAFLERRGKSYVALPAGRLPVRFKASLRLLDDLDPILAVVDGFLRSFPTIPATFAAARRRIDEAIYGVSVQPTQQQFAYLVRAMGRMEILIAQRDRSKKPVLNRPLHGLSPEWVVESDEGGPEVRIALALASIHATAKVGAIRANMSGVDAGKPWLWAISGRQQRWFGSSLVERLGGVLAQRMMDAARLKCPVVPIQAAIEIAPADVVPFLLGETDDQLIEELLWGFSLLDWSKKDGVERIRRRWAKGLATGPLPRGWCLLKLLHQPQKVQGRELKWEARIHSLLAADRPDEALAIARRRLRSHSLVALPIADGDWVDPQRQRAALLIPTRDSRVLERLVLNEKKSANLS